MGEGNNTPMNVYISKDGQLALFGKANSIEITEEAVFPTQGTIRGNEVEPMNLSYLGTTYSITIDIELDEFNTDLLLEVGTPQIREVDYRFVLGTQVENGFGWDYGGADDLIEFLSLLLRGHVRGHGDIFLFYWVLGNYYELKVELLDGSDYHAYDGLKSISLDGHVVTPTAPMLFRVVNFLCMRKADTELVLDGARVRLRVSRIGSNESNENDKEDKQMEYIMNCGWVCPVCGKANAPWVSQCTCNGKLPAPCKPTCNTGTSSVSPISATHLTPEEYQKAIEDYLNINSTYDPVIDSSGKIHKIDDGPSDSTANN